MMMMMYYVVLMLIFMFIISVEGGTGAFICRARSIAFRSHTDANVFEVDTTTHYIIMRLGRRDAKINKQIFALQLSPFMPDKRRLEHHPQLDSMAIKH